MKNELVKLIRTGKLEIALTKGEEFLALMKDHYYGWAMLQSRYNDKKNEHLKGILSQENFTQEVNRINSDLLDLVLKVDKDARLSFQEEKIEEISLKEQLQQKLIASHHILDILSEGTSTVTYKAKELFGDDFVAIRVLKNTNLFKSTDAFEEVSKVKKINHRNIISVLGQSAVDSNLKYVIMEYVNGIELESLILENGSRPLRETKHILLKICDALYYLHKRKIFNADLRATRILIDDEGEPMISPFIVFRTKSENNYNQIISNLKYMSYQRLNSKDYKHYTPQSNQFSLGVVAYLLLVGESLFDSDSIIDLIEARSAFEKDDAYREEKLSKMDGSTELIAMVNKLLSKKRKDRFPNMHEVIVALQNIEDDSKRDHKTAQESYSRARSCNPEITIELVEKINDEDFKNLPDLDRKQYAQKLHHIISLIIETDSNKSYLTKVVHSKVLSTLFFQHFSVFKENLYELLKEYDYLWTKEIQAAWESTLEETLEEVNVEYK